MKPFALVAASIAAAAIAGCYRLAGPPDLGEAVRVEVVGNDGKLVRSQGYLTDAVADALVKRLGWRVSPTGTAKLQLAIREEKIKATAQDTRDVTDAWSVRLDGTALLVARGGSLTGTFTGLGNYTGLHTIQGEPEALQAAAVQAADDLVSWLDANATRVIPATAP